MAGGAAGWIGGLIAFWWFVIPPIMGILVYYQGESGYVMGFVVFIVLAPLTIQITRAHFAKEEQIL